MSDINQTWEHACITASIKMTCIINVDNEQLIGWLPTFRLYSKDASILYSPFPLQEAYIDLNVCSLCSIIYLAAILTVF